MPPRQVRPSPSLRAVVESAHVNGALVRLAELRDSRSCGERISRIREVWAAAAP
jgi:hypothetical protein